MLRILFFNLVYIANCGYALARGGLPERLGAAVLILDFQLSHWLIAPLARRYAGVEWPMMAVDAFAFGAFYLMSLGSTRFWPIWLTAMQGCVALSHVVGLDRQAIPWVYGNFVVLWSYLQLAVLGVGTRRHRLRLARYGFDPAWCWQLPVAYRSGRRVDELDLPGPTSP